MVVNQLLLAAKAALTDLNLSDGVVNALTLNKYGRLRVASKPGDFLTTTGNLSLVGDQLAVDCSETSTVTFLLKNTGSTAMTAGTFIFEASPNSTTGLDGDWINLNFARSNSNVQEASVAIANLASAANLGWAYKASVAGYKWVRVRCTVAVSASSIATVVALRSSSPSEPNPVIGSHPVTQSGAWVVTQSGTVSVSQAAPVASTQSGAWTVAATQSGTWNVGGTGTFNTAPNAASGTPYTLLSTATAIAQSIKASAGAITEMTAFNNTAATVYIKLYNKASAPVPASDVPIDTIPVAAGAHFAMELGSLGKRFSTGIAIGVTGAAGVTDATAIAAGLQVSATYI